MNKMRATFRTVFTSSDGEEVLDCLKNKFFYNSGTFVPNDPYTTVWSEGQRAVVLFIENMIKESIELPEEAENEDE